jgi:hypothetical protein
MSLQKIDRDEMGRTSRILGDLVREKQAYDDQQNLSHPRRKPCLKNKPINKQAKQQ